MTRPPLHIWLSEILMAILMVVLVAATFTQVLMRYVFNYSLPWADELARTGLVWLVFSGMAVCFARGQHAVVGLMLDRYAGRSGRLACLLIDILIFTLFAAMLYGGAQLALLTAEQRSSGLGISRGLVYAALPIGALPMLIELLLQNYQRFFAPHRPTG
jgi:TRAP-type C4-dicarboxylate transport system permease small subunit